MNDVYAFIVTHVWSRIESHFFGTHRLSNPRVRDSRCALYTIYLTFIRCLIPIFFISLRNHDFSKYIREKRNFLRRMREFIVDVIIHLTFMVAIRLL